MVDPIRSRRREYPAPASTRTVWYPLDLAFETPRFQVCRWVSAEKRTDLDAFTEKHRGDMAEDLDGSPVFMAPSAFMLKFEIDRAPEVQFSDVKDYQREAVAK